MSGERLKIAVGDHKMAENRHLFLQEIGDWSIRVYMGYLRKDWDNKLCWSHF